MTIFGTIVVGCLALSLAVVGLAALDETYKLRDRKFLTYDFRAGNVLSYLASLPVHKKASLAALLGLSCFIVLGLLLKGF
jgi:hypothetical protein